MKRLLKVFITFGLLIAVMPLAFAADMSAQPAVTEEQKAMQGRMQEYMTPNKNHALLQSLEGTWKAEVQFWMDPKGEAQVTQGMSESKMIMNGRFLEQKYNGLMMGKPFEGRGIYGYDNIREEFTGIWFDNMATGMMISSAKYNSMAKTLTEEGSMSCPITNEAHRWYRAVTTFTDADHYKYESYMKDKDGNEFKGMMINYTRVD